MNIALLYERHQWASPLLDALREVGIDVVFDTRASALDASALAQMPVQAIVVNLDADLEDHLDELEERLGGDRRPLIYNDALVSDSLSGWDQARWARHLAAKISGRADVHPPTPHGASALADPDLGVGAVARRVFILAASIGGPEAVRAFLGALKNTVPAAFVLAQHMGAEFLELMSQQLDKATDLDVHLPRHGELLRNGEVLVTPVGRRLTISADGLIELSEPPGKSPYSPCIDQVMRDFAQRYGADCGAIIFSGMASDSIAGARAIASAGGPVWVQDPETCVVSSMVDGAREAGVVSFTGTPEMLARHFVKTYAGA